MAEFKDLISSSIKHGKKNFTDVSKTEVVNDDGDNNVFIGVSGGFLGEEGKNYKSNVTFPVNSDVAKKIAASILHSAGVKEFDYQKVRDKIDFEEDE